MTRRSVDQRRFVRRLLQLVLFSVCIISVVVLLRRSTLHMKHVYSNITVPQLDTNEVLFSTKPLVIWSNDYHVATIKDLKHLLMPLGVRFIDKSLACNCHLTNTCSARRSLKVINFRNAMNLHPSLIPRFYKAYEKSAEMKSVDAFVCFHPTSMCELFMPFNKSLIVIASTRYELGRFKIQRWKKWNSNLLQISKTPPNFVGANNLYDIEYIKYFTGMEVQYIPSYCGYTASEYAPSRSEFLLVRRRNGFQQSFIDEYEKFCENMTCYKMISLWHKYRYHNFSDLTTYAGLVHIPYQVSIMAIFEQYRMNIPLFFPSLDLLTTWQHKHVVSVNQIY